MERTGGRIDNATATLTTWLSNMQLFPKQNGATSRRTETSQGVFVKKDAPALIAVGFGPKPKMG